MQAKILRLFNSLKESVFTGPGDIPPETRQFIREKIQAEVSTGSSETCSPPVLNQYIEKLARNSYKIVDQDIANLKAEGYTESEIFELSVAVSWAAGVARFEKGQELLNTLEA